MSFPRALAGLIAAMPLEKRAFLGIGEKHDEYGATYLTPRKVKQIGFQLGIPVADNPSFAHFAEHETGTADLAHMNQWQLHSLVHAMRTRLQGAFTPAAPSGFLVF